MNRKIVLNARPVGGIKPSDFSLVEDSVPEPGPDEALVRATYLAVEPAMRGWMDAEGKYTQPVGIGEVMRGHAIGEVISSRNPSLPEKTLVTGMLGWQEYSLQTENTVQVIPSAGTLLPTAYLGPLGLTGITAYFGITEIAKVEASDTVLVSGAAGATGSVAGQLAKHKGARVIGIAGGKKKCDWLRNDLGFDAVIDYKSEDVAAVVSKHCPQGLNVFYDNVGGEILDIALANLAVGARVVLCGGISRYNETETIAGPQNYFNLVYKRARMEGFILIDYVDRFGEAQDAIAQLIKDGELKYGEDILDGFEKLPEALMGLFEGRNTGKQLVKA